MFFSLFHTLVHRWYVFLFLLSYLLIASYHWGWKRSIKLLLIGYFVAWASEASSIRNGFPYGFYQYHYDQMPHEIFAWGVPIWDSLSYPFLAFAGYMMALYLQSRWKRFTPLPELQQAWSTVFLGAAMTMILDVIIDPVAKRGSQWFLGDIYSYPFGGGYFGVPLSNFAGWFLVALLILGLFRLTDRLEGVPKSIDSVKLGGLFFWGVYFFNLSITVYIHAYSLAIVSSLWGILIFIASKFGRKSNLQELI
jgi:putative membrane protein